MDTAGNVTSLHRRRRARKTATRASTVMDQCRERLCEHMRAALPGIMDQVDDALFDLADKADTNQLQSTYFEAMRSVRLCRGEIEKRFVSELETVMARKCGAGRHTARGGEAARSGPLSLVNQDDLEESVAVKNIAGKISNLCHEELFALDRRVALLLSSPTLEGEDNPLGPFVLCSAARCAVDVIEASVEIRLLVLKLFDRHLTRAAEHFYPEINAFLVRQGVLPNVAAGIPVRSRGTRSHRPRDSGGRAAPPAAGGHTWDGQGAGSGAGWERYHAHAAPHASPRPAAGGARAVSPAPAPVAGGIRGEQVLGVLDQVMRVGGNIDAGEEAPGRRQFIGSLTTLQRNDARVATGNMVRELRASGAASGISHTDGLMIDVVAMMFDFILKDDNIGDAMRALIGRLQIPVLKVAILDKSFFARRSHPARGFINLMADFGARMGTDDADHASALGRVRELVTRILDDFEEQLDVFSAAHEELRAIVAQDDDTAERNAWSSAQVAQGRDRLARCRRIADEHVEERLQDAEAPEVVARFAREHWRHLLGERLFRDGEQGESWRAGLQTLDQLLWSARLKCGAVERGRLLAMLPFMLERLKGGMQELGMPPESRARFLRSFSDLHIAVMRGEEAAGSGAAKGAPAPVQEPGGTAATGPAHASGQARGPQSAAAPLPGSRARSVLKDAVERANERVWATAEERPQCQGMGTTVVALKLQGDRLVCAHAGDSRLYRLRAGVLAQLSDDHTYRAEGVAKGLVTPEEAEGIANNMITRAVGGDATLQVDVNVHDTAPGDLFLCCSDGLTDMVDDARIAALLTETTGLDAVAGALVAAANEAGGRDNISVGLLRVDDTLPPSEGGEPRDYGAFVSMATATDPGLRRAHNEDCIECVPSLGAMVLADGMGGHNAGEVASAMTVRIVLDAVRDTVDGAPAQVADADFDFKAITAVFWDDQVPAMDNQALYEAVGQEVQSIVLSSGDDLDVFDLDGEGAADGGALDVDVVQDAARDPLLDRVLKLGCGTWVEFGEERGRGVRARLSWIAPERARYLFTDRLGRKVSDATPYGLAVELRCGRMRVLDGVPLFERAVSSLTRRLRSPQPEGVLH